MSDRWQFGSYTFKSNPTDYSENISYVGDTVVTLNGNVITQPTYVQEKYQIQSIFFQHRPLIRNIVAVSNANAIEFKNNKFYELDSKNAKVNVYNSNFALQKSINVVSTYSNAYTSFDVDTSENIYLSTWDGQISHMVKVNSSGTLVSDGTYRSGYKIVAIQNYNGQLYVVTSDSVLHMLNPLINGTYNDNKSSSLPYMPPDQLGYQGATIIDHYIVVSYFSDWVSGAYHIDLNNGATVNHFELPSANIVNDICYDGNNFVFLDKSNNQLVYSNGNTVDVDVYELRLQLDTQGMLLMTDDMGFDVYVFANDYTVNRDDTNIVKYQVSIDVEKVDRGMNQ